ncbi:MAG: transcriptional repressor NrdR [Coriobacteriaceae bacterium]|nr:transcriptional regulator NrdR [Olsenella sp.]MCI1288453.1 transcriptional regulator NrdR [Olsenella sp.]RRF90365.1 MAG: transcriptional repressor NrdR [Coriobacteriaceae bacterium]
MRCPKCGCSESKVVDSRPSENNDAIRRRRECVKCGTRFTTYERREEMPLIVIKKDGSKETFDRQKIMRGLVAATVKRDVPLSKLNALIDDIESYLRDNGKTEVESQEIGKLVLQRLIDIDKVAYVRFASVYRDFKDVDEFNAELRSLANEQTRD